MKKIFLFILLFLLINNACIYASELDYLEYINKFREYGEEVIPEIYDNDFVTSLLTGNINLDNEKFLDRIVNIFLKEIKENFKLVFKIFAICIFCSIIKNLQLNNENGVSEVLFYVCYIFTTIILIRTFFDITTLCKSTVSRLNAFTGFLIPTIIIYLAISRKYNYCINFRTSIGWYYKFY